MKWPRGGVISWPHGEPPAPRHTPSLHSSHTGCSQNHMCTMSASCHWPLPARHPLPETPFLPYDSVNFYLTFRPQLRCYCLLRAKLCVSPTVNPCAEVLTPAPSNVTVLGDQSLSEVTNVR